MSKHQTHFGRKFYQDKKTGYWMSTDRPRIRAHQWVWNNFYQKPPPGYHLHHINENKSDNRIENLEMIKGSRHVSIHMLKKMNDPEKKRKNIENCEKIRHLTKVWHSSEEGRSWHRYHAIKHKFGKGDPIKYNCEVCSTQFYSTKRSNTRFCCNACKSKWRRDVGLDDIEKYCVLCNKKFMSNKYSKKICCSLSCAAKFRWKTKDCVI